MKNWLKRLALGLLVLTGSTIVVWSMTGLAMAAGGWDSPPRGQLVDIGGRKLRMVCQGERADGQPLVLFEAGAYSGSADWGFIQPEVAGFARTCSYDRAGIGWSDPGPEPRTSTVIAKDLRALLSAAGETGPYVVVGHSMAGILMRSFILEAPDDVVGAVFIDAADPAMIADPDVAVWIARYQRLARWGATASRFGLVKPLTPFFANRIGLPDGLALREKRRLFGHPRHLRGAAAEINQIGSVDGSLDLSGAEARLAQIPVSSITAGAGDDRRHGVAMASPDGNWMSLEGANHTTLLGPDHGRRVVEEVARVLAALSGAAAD